MLSALQKLGFGHTSFFYERSLSGLHAMPVSCGYSLETQNTYDWHGLKRGKAEFVLLQVTLSGEGRLEYEGEVRAVKPGDALLLHFPHEHRYYLPQGQHWRFIWAVLNGRELLRIWKELEGRCGPLVSLRAKSKVVTALAELILLARQQRIVSPFDASARAYGLAMILLQEVAFEATGTRSPQLQRAIRFAQKHFAQEIGVEELAREAGYSRFHFTRVFKRSEGLSPVEYINRLRLRHAHRLLQDGILSIKEIASACGFATPNYFCKLFKRECGRSPGSLRKGGL